MTLPQVLFLFIALTLLTYLLLQERRATSKVPLWVRYIAGLLAIVALLGWMFPISYPVGWHRDGGTDGFTVLTSGTPDSTISVVAKSQYAVTTDGDIAQRYQIPFIQDWVGFLNQHPTSALDVHGFGLTQVQQAAVTSRPLTYHRPPLPQGVIFCEWPRQLQASTPFTVQGQYHNPSDRELKVFLLSASQPVDSATIAPQGVHLFSLSYLPKQLGNNLFGLATVDGKDTTRVEKLPVSIIPAQTLRTVMLAAAPSFEYKFMTNWLQQLHYATAFRARISTAKFATAYSEEMDLSLSPPLRETTFNNIDLLIADETELSALSQGEQQAIARAVRSGMGLLLFLGDEKNRSLLSEGFSRSPASDQQGQAIALTTMDGKEYPKLLASPFGSIQTKPSQQSLVYHGSQTVAASQLYGNGRVTATTFNGSYAWWLRNQQSAYTQFWSFLLDNTTSGIQYASLDVQLPRFPTIYTQTNMVLQQPADSSLAIDGQSYPLLQHEYLSDFFQLTFWSQRPGWHVITTQQADSTWFYVYERNDWQAAKNVETINAMDGFYSRYQTQSTKNTTQEIQRKQVPKWIFFVLFLAASSVLWYASREYNQNVM